MFDINVYESPAPMVFLSPPPGLSVFSQIFGARQNLKRLTLDLILKLMQGYAATLQHSGGQAAAGSAE